MATKTPGAHSVHVVVSEGLCTPMAHQPRTPPALHPHPTPSSSTPLLSTPPLGPTAAPRASRRTTTRNTLRADDRGRLFLAVVVLSVALATLPPVVVAVVGPCPSGKYGQEKYLQVYVRSDGREDTRIAPAAFSHATVSNDNQGESYFCLRTDTSATNLDTGTCVNAGYNNFVDKQNSPEQARTRDGQRNGNAGDPGHDGSLPWRYAGGNNVWTGLNMLWVGRVGTNWETTSGQVIDVEHESESWTYDKLRKGSGGKPGLEDLPDGHMVAVSVAASASFYGDNDANQAGRELTGYVDGQLRGQLTVREAFVVVSQIKSPTPAPQPSWNVFDQKGFRSSTPAKAKVSVPLSEISLAGRLRRV